MISLINYTLTTTTVLATGCLILLLLSIGVEILLGYIESARYTNRRK